MTRASTKPSSVAITMTTGSANVRIRMRTVMFISPGGDPGHNVGAQQLYSSSQIRRTLIHWDSDEKLATVSTHFSLQTSKWVKMRRPHREYNESASHLIADTIADIDFWRSVPRGDLIVEQLAFVTGLVVRW